MTNEEQKNQLMREVALKLMHVSSCYDEFNHGLDFENSFLMDVIERVTDLPHDEVVKIRKQYLNCDDDE